MKKLLSILGCICLLIGLLGILVSADTEEPLLVDIQFSTKKDTYDAGDSIQTTLEIKNNYDYPLTNLTVLVDAPEGYQIEDPEALPAGSGLDAGKKASLSVKLVPEGTTPFNWGLLWIIVGAVIAGIAVIAVVVILILRKKLKAKTVVSMLLVSITLASMSTMWVQADAAEIARHSVTKELTLTLDGKPQTVTATVNFDTNPLADEVTLDTSRMSYSQSQEAFMTTPEFDGFFGTLKNPRAYSEIYLEVYNSQDHLLQKHSVKAAKQWRFEEVGLCPGINRIRITVVGNAPLTLQFDLLDLHGKTFHLLEGYDADTDGDGIPDLVEANLGTDPASTDTDGDGISDMDELELDLDPTKADTDGNGTDDGKDDTDGDSISNAEELKKGLSPILADTDRDGIDDNDELKKHKTDPLKTDSDGDGASDGWELENGYKPAKKEQAFSLSAETAPVSELNPVSAAVSLKVNGNEADVESLEISSVSVADNPYLSSCIAGYLGSAYDFTLDGTFDSATLTFRYDPALGQPGEDFDPRICYFNPDTNNFELLPDQTVKDGVVTAKTTHFSIYSLIDWSELKDTLEAGYNYYTETKENGKEAALTALATADIAIVMDNSASMAWNDPADKCREVATYFVNHIRPKYDSISLLTYTNTPTLVTPATSDPAVLLDALDKIHTDNGVGADSGTNGLAALNAAIDSLRGGGGANRYILFFSDGDDLSLQREYDAVVRRAIAANVKLLCVGIHTTKTSFLSVMADDTKGHYYILDENVDVEKAFGHAISVFDEITPTEKDSNNDGISDFITKMIFEGKITLQNGDKSLMYVDLNLDMNNNPSDDWDGDGLKNGEEIRFTYGFFSKTAYMSMRSHPCMVDSDIDGFTDKEEKQNGSDPMRISVQAEPTDYLLGKGFYYIDVVNERDPDTLPDGWKWLGHVNNFFFDIDSMIFGGGISNHREIYYEVMAKYFLEYGAVAREDAEVRSFIRNAIAYLDTIQSDYVDKHIELANTVADSSVIWDLTCDTYKLRLELAKLAKGGVKLKDINISDSAVLREVTKGLVKLQVKIPVKWSGAKTTKDIFKTTRKWAKKASDYSDAVGKVGDVLTFVEAGVDMLNTYKIIAQIEANDDLFLENLDILEDLVNNSDDKFASAAAREILMLVSDNFLETLAVAYQQRLRDIYQFGLAMIPKALECVPVVGTIVAILDAAVTITDFLTETSKEVETTYKILCYNEIVLVHRGRGQAALGGKAENGFYHITEDQKVNFMRHICNLEALHALAEDEFYEHYDAASGLFTWIRAKEVRGYVDDSIFEIKKAAEHIKKSEIYRKNHGGAGRPF